MNRDERRGRDANRRSQDDGGEGEWVMAINESCVQCRFYSAENAHGGKCRRFPPVVVPIHQNRNPDRPWPNMDHDSMWPDVRTDDTCGEFLR